MRGKPARGVLLQGFSFLDDHLALPKLSHPLCPSLLGNAVLSFSGPYRIGALCDIRCTYNPASSRKFHDTGVSASGRRIAFDTPRLTASGSFDSSNFVIPQPVNPRSLLFTQSVSCHRARDPSLAPCTPNMTRIYS
jgi:hypothetical protein